MSKKRQTHLGQESREKHQPSKRGRLDDPILHILSKQGDEIAAVTEDEAQNRTIADLIDEYGIKGAGFTHEWYQAVTRNKYGLGDGSGDGWERLPNEQYADSEIPGSFRLVSILIACEVKLEVNGKILVVTINVGPEWKIRTIFDKAQTEFGQNAADFDCLRWNQKKGPKMDLEQKVREALAVPGPFSLWGAMEADIPSDAETMGRRRRRDG